MCLKSLIGLLKKHAEENWWVVKLSSETIDKIVSNDTYFDEANATTNYGSSVSLYLKNVSGSDERQIYLHFNLGAMPVPNAVITSLILRLRVQYIAATPDDAVRVRRGNHDSFDEDDPSWSNLNQAEGIAWDASPGDPITDRDYGYGATGVIALWKPTIGGYYDINIGALLAVDSLDWEDDIVLLLKFDSNNTNNDFYIYAKESGSGYEPILRIGYTDPAPPAPTNLAVISVDSRDLRIEWNEPSDSDLSTVELERATSKYGSYSNIATKSAGTEYHDDTGVVSQTDIHDYDVNQDTYPEGRTLWYRVRAKDANNNYSGYSDPVSGTTKKPIQPIKVSNILGIYEDSKYKLQFDFDWAVFSTPDDDFDKVEVRYEEESGTNPTISSTLDATIYRPDVKSHKLDKAGAGAVEFTTYRFLAIAYDEGGLYRYNADEEYIQQIPEGDTLCSPCVAMRPISPTTFNSGTVVEFDMRQSSKADSTSPLADFLAANGVDKNWWEKPTGTVIWPLQDGEAWKFYKTGADEAGIEMPPTWADKCEAHPSWHRRTNDMLIKINMKMEKWNSARYFMMYLRYTDSNNYWAIEFRTSADSNSWYVTLCIKRSGVENTYNSTQKTNPEDYRDWIIKIVEDKVSVYYENTFTRVVTATDSAGAFTNGYFRLVGWKEGVGYMDENWDIWVKRLTIYGMWQPDVNAGNGITLAFGDGDNTGLIQPSKYSHIYNALPDQSSNTYDYYANGDITDGRESWNVPNQTLTVNNVNPVAYLIVQSTTIKNVEMTAYGHLSYDQEGGIDDTNGYEFDFGEGGGWEATSNSYKTHTYTTTGTKTVKLRVKDEAGNYSNTDQQDLVVYDSGSVGTQLTLMCPFHNIKEIPKGTISTLPYPELDYDGIQAMGSENLRLLLEGEHHDPDESKTPAQRETSMKTERDAWKEAAELGTLVRYTFPQYGELTGHLVDYQAELDERDYYRLPFTVTFIVVTEEQIQEP